MQLIIIIKKNGRNLHSYNILNFSLVFFRHLNSSNLTKISRPTLLITDALNTKYSQGQRKTKDAQLLSTNKFSI
jgi:hypothetical protein